MKIKTDETHKSFRAKHLKKNKANRIAVRVAGMLIALGFAATCSGCGKKEYDDHIVAYQDGNLSSYESDIISSFHEPVDEDFIDHLPNLKRLYLSYDNYLTDLSNLPNVCPSLEVLDIWACYGITNFEFVKELKNLKEFNIDGDTVGVTEDLINYLDRNNIKHNLDHRLVDIDNQISDIVNEIITDDMNDQEKLNAITYYVMNNIKYKLSLSEESNENALQCALEGEGVCASYAALTSAMCSKAGIESYYIGAGQHAWNLVQIQGKYYYVDPTNIGQIPFLSDLLLEKFGKGFYYMQDPYDTKFSVMKDIENNEVDPPERLMQLIKESEDEKSFIERYGSNSMAIFYGILGILIGTMAVKIKIERSRY